MFIPPVCSSFRQLTLQCRLISRISLAIRTLVSCLKWVEVLKLSQVGKGSMLSSGALKQD